MAVIPLPTQYRNLLGQNSHPGLQQDKFGPTHSPGTVGDRYADIQRQALDELIRVNNGQTDALLQGFVKRYTRSLELQGVKSLDMMTSSPLALHLSRGSSLENAGVCLHPIYGFAYLPGTGLKGLARAYAETVWLPMQPSEIEAERKILAVFGNKVGGGDGPKSDKRFFAGSINFYDAWPTKWPKLILDIVNNHHAKYYQGRGNDERSAPGDWEEPIIINFPAVDRSTPFRFFVGKRRPTASDESLQLAEKWLTEALCHNGAGAKTNAGYGRFRPATAQAVPAIVTHADRLSFTSTLELVTPAFLAGADQFDPAGCDLRPSTLRGQLRWWWRTLHAGYVDVETLRKLEAAVWGDTMQGGAVAIDVARLPLNNGNQWKPERCPFMTIVPNRQRLPSLRFDSNFGKHHEFFPAEAGMSQGIVYSSYGMDVMDAGRLDTRRQRWYAMPGARWVVTVTARSSTYAARKNQNGREVGPHLSASVILDQVRAALWWLSRLGGVGAKARKGFGSLQDVNWSDGFFGGQWIDHGSQLRTACELPGAEFTEVNVHSPSLRLMRDLTKTVIKAVNGQHDPGWLEIDTTHRDPWLILDDIGAGMQSFAQSRAESGHGRHCDSKRHLGLPRSIHRNPKTALIGALSDRHPAPAIYHVSTGGHGLAIRAATFPSAQTRAKGTPATVGLLESSNLLTKLLTHLHGFWSGRAAD